MSRRLFVIFGLAVLMLSACGQVHPVQPAAGGYRLFLAEGMNASGVTVRDSGSGAIERQLPFGTPSADWSHYYTVSGTHLGALDPRSGKSLGQITIPAGFSLPDLSYSGLTAGLSPNGQWLALVNHHSQAASGGTEFLVGSSALTSPFKHLQLTGNYQFDALSNDGRSLYLIQTLSEPNHYQVRLYDLATMSLAAQPVVDKREANEPMNGLRGDSAADAAGNHVYTVYVREGGPFVHALPLDQPFAWCIDLPSKAGGDLEKQWRWSLAMNADGSKIYAVNPIDGSVAVITPGEPPKVTRTATIAMGSSEGLFAGLVTPAEAKGPLLGGAALSADGQTLFAIGDSSILAIDTATLKLRARLLAGESLQSIRLSSDGKWLYAVGASSTKVWQINPATGALSEVKGVSQPWAVFWAEAK